MDYNRVGKTIESRIEKEDIIDYSNYIINDYVELNDESMGHMKSKLKKRKFFRLILTFDADKKNDKRKTYSVFTDELKNGIGLDTYIQYIDKKPGKLVRIRDNEKDPRMKANNEFVRENYRTCLDIIAGKQVSLLVENTIKAPQKLDSLYNQKPKNKN